MSDMTLTTDVHNPGVPTVTKLTTDGGREFFVAKCGHQFTMFLDTADDLRAFGQAFIDAANSQGEAEHLHTFNDSPYFCDDCGTDIKEIQ